MILRYDDLSTHPTVFKSMTGLRVAEFDALVRDLWPRDQAAEQRRLSRPTRQRAIGAGHPCELTARDQLLLTVVWLRVYPTDEVLGYLFAVSDTTVGRTSTRLPPLLEAAGLDSMRLPDPGRKHRRHLADLLADTADLVILIDTFAQRVPRPRDRSAADKRYRGKKQQHTRKSQVATAAITGQVVEVPDSVPGPTADSTLVEQSGVLARLPDGVGAAGDLGYVGLDKLPAQGVMPRRTPRGQARPPADLDYNRAFARRRVGGAHTLGRMRRYQALTQTDRHHRQHHPARVRAVAGLVNRQLARLVPYRERLAS